MFLKRKEQIIEYQKDLDPTQMAFCQNARLLYVNGNGALSTKRWQVNSQWREYYLQQVTLKGVPLWRVNQSACPTCESLLVTGLGIERANAGELREIADKINSGYVDFDSAVDSIMPLLSLLETGLYIVADKWMFPTDGGEHFFWDVPDAPTPNMATAGMYLSQDEDFEYVYSAGEPAYLYPTQSVSCYNEERVRYYMDKYKAGDTMPRAIAYHCTEWMSFLLDGHHKACAAILLGQPVRCLVIMPYQHGVWGGVRDKLRLKELCFEGMNVKVEEVPEKYLPGEQKPAFAPASSIPEALESPEECRGSLGTRSWEETYRKAVASYPKVQQYAIMRSAGIVSRVTDRQIKEALACPDQEGRRRLRGILTCLQCSGDARLKDTALACARMESPDYPRMGLGLKKHAFEFLCQIRDDEEIERFFIDCLAQDEDPHSELGWIASSYWD